MFADLINGHDVGMVEIGRRLISKNAASASGSKMAGQVIFRRRRVQADLAGLEHDAHAAASDLFQQLIVAEVALCSRPRLGSRFLSALGFRAVASAWAASPLTQRAARQSNWGVGKNSDNSGAGSG